MVPSTGGLPHVFPSTGGFPIELESTGGFSLVVPSTGGLSHVFPSTGGFPLVLPSTALNVFTSITNILEVIDIQVRMMLLIFILSVLTPRQMT